MSFRLWPSAFWVLSQPPKHCHSTWTTYINKKSTFANANTFEKAKAMPGATFWQMHGSTLPDLHRLAMIVLSQPVSVWSTYGWIQSKLRSRLLPNRARKLVMVHFALRHEAMRLKGQWDTDLLDWVDDKQLWHPDTDSDTDSGDDDEPLVRARHLKRRFR